MEDNDNTQIENKETGRKKTLSKNYYNDEILYIDELGIHLKPGVKRMKFPTIKDGDMESHINYWEKAMSKIQEVKHIRRDWDE